MSEKWHAPTKPPALPGSSPSRLPLVLLLVFVFLPAIALVIWYVNVRTSNTSAIRKLEQQARQHGEPLTLAELQAKYPTIPDEENSAVALMALWETEDPVFWKAFRNGEPTLPEPVAKEYDPALPYLGSNAVRVLRVGPLNSNSLAAAEAYLGTNAWHLERMRAALRRPRCRFSVQITDGPGVLLPHLGALQTEAKNFRIVALIAAACGDKDAAMLALKDTARIGQLLSGEPVLISQLVRVSCLNLALDGVEQLLSRQQVTTDELEQLRLFLEDLNLQGVARSVLVNERPFALCEFDPEMFARAAMNEASTNDIITPDQTARGIAIGYGAVKSAGFLDPDRRLILETFKEAIDLAGQQTPESFVKFDELFDEALVKARTFPQKRFSDVFLPGLRKVLVRFATFEARRRAGLTAIAVERSRLEHEGRIPETLDEIVPVCLSTIPRDPFDGQALRFRKLERGFVVYSVGQDREDNGGRERLPGTTKRDVTFIVER